MIIDYILVTVSTKERGLIDVKVFDCAKKSEAKKEAVRMEGGVALSAIIMYRKKS